MLCRYQFEMLRDSYRLEAYDKAIKAAVTFKKEFSSEELFILDIGANSGILPMLAARHVVYTYAYWGMDLTFDYYDADRWLGA